MIVLGIDPGTRRVGYGAVEDAGGSMRLLGAGLLEIKSGDDLGALKEIGNGIEKLIKKFRPALLSIEKLYFSKNRKTAIAVAQARGAIILRAMELGLKIREYSPNEVKMAITGYGLADKRAVLKMVRLILVEPKLSVIDDASDALALAILSTRRGG